MNGFVIMDKAQGMTSFRASSVLRKIYSEKKTGHTGTLDPMATGVLPVALGKASRFIPFLPDNDKAYLARFCLGLSTDTLDITGKELKREEVDISLEQVNAVLPRFRGEILQTPPMYSALQQDGVRLYELARKGIEVEREPRQITVYELSATQADNGEFQLCVKCSKGTYIRSLIADIGLALGTYGCMTALRRTLSNGFTLLQAHTEEELKQAGEKAVLPMDAPFVRFPAVTVTPAQAIRFANGGELNVNRIHDITEPKQGLYRVYSPEQEFLGLGEIENHALDCLKVKRVVGK